MASAGVPGRAIAEPEFPALGAEAPAIPRPRITQDAITSGDLKLTAIRAAGRRIFATPFNALDGLGDGPMDPNNSTAPGGRPTLQNNGMFLRINGLDSQSCVECHNALSTAEFPPTFAVGGAGPAAANALPGVIAPDIADREGNGFAAISGRFINPPFIFGSGAVELLAKEMTLELQRLKQQALANPDTPTPLSAKNVDFGTLVCNAQGSCDTQGVEGIDADLVVRPFGRKGVFATTRAFDVGAMQFHHGMQPVEAVGEGVDADGDGIVDELLVGELSALHIFMATSERPKHRRSRNRALRRLENRGEEVFQEVGCARCHIPELTTDHRKLDFSFPENHQDPSRDVYFSVDLSDGPANFRRARGGGLLIELFADLRRHDMGPLLRESTGDPLDSHFTTARLWGVADTAPYLHDGRASTLTEAILFHGGDADGSRRAFEELSEQDAAGLIAFLRTLRAPRSVGKDLNRFERSR